jgi:hypothetical protein
VNIDQALKEIQDARVNLNMLEAWLKKHSGLFEHPSIVSQVSTSVTLSPYQVFVYAGPNPRGFAKQFGGSCHIIGDTWEMKFASFQMTMMNATASESVIL